MGACHRQHMTALKHMFGQPLGPAGIRRAGFQDGFHFDRSLWVHRHQQTSVGLGITKPRKILPLHPLHTTLDMLPIPVTLIRQDALL